MCGIFCVIGNISKRQDDFMKDMFIMDSLRGPHSCGIFNVIDYSSEVQSFKRAVLPHDFLDMKGLTSTIAKKNKVLVGHNRWATKGKVNNVNAHPFTVGDITGVHNGTLTNQNLLPDSKEFEVDSKNIFHSIDKIGIDQTWKRIHGFANLMWWDEKAETFNVIRKDGRPLFYTYSKDRQQFYAASEKYMLMAALERNNIEFTQVVSMPLDKLFTFKINMKDKNPNNRIKVTKRKLESYQPPVVVSAQRQQSWHTGYKSFGEFIDFYVEEVLKFKNMTLYKLIDNKDQLPYRIEVYNKEPQLDLGVGELATGKLTQIRSGLYYIRASSVKRNSKYFFPEDDAIEGEVEEEETGGSLSDAEWKKLHSCDCAWCGSPVAKTESYLLTEAGQLFCEDCKDKDDVQVMVNPVETVQ